MNHSKDNPIREPGNYWLFVEEWGYQYVRLAEVPMLTDGVPHIRCLNPAGPQYIPLPEDYYWEGPLPYRPDLPEEVRRKWGKQMYLKETARIRS